MTLVAHYNMEQSSGALEDKANNNDSTSVTVTSRTATGILGGNAWDFDGVDDYVDLPFSFADVWTTDEPASASAWVKLGSTGNQNIVGHYDGTYQTLLDIDASTQVRFGSYDGTSRFLAGTTSLSTDQWYHLAGVFDGSNIRVYVNGKEDNSGSFSNFDLETRNLDIGRHYDNGSNGRYLDGQVDEVRFYDHALTPQEVQYLYEVTKRGEHVSAVK